MDIIRKGLLIGALGALAVLGAGCSDDSSDETVYNNVGPETKIALLASYNDYDWSDDQAESSSTDAAIQSLGHKTLAFFSIDPDTISRSLQDKDVLVIPEIFGVGDLNADISDESRSLINMFVANGGTLVTFSSDTATYEYNFLNGTFGFSLAAGTLGAPWSYNGTGAAGTPFAGGPATLEDNGFHHDSLSAASLPIDGKAIYTDATNDDAVVAAIPYGDGWIYFLGWDFARAEPIGTMDGNWLDILDRAVR
jgi:hypothetical protein